jgi:protocatechuate 3,4-dioxygenase beta subunit
MNKETRGVMAVTASVEEGPYYKEGSPERTAIAAAGTPGIKFTLTGRVFDTRGRPIARAWVDFWHADGNGVYDNDGFNLRGHQYTNKGGYYRLETVRPRQYLSRAPHIHVKVRATDTSPVLTTQLFFPGEERNKTDTIFEPRTLMDVIDVPGGQKATYDFAVATD